MTKLALTTLKYWVIAEETLHRKAGEAYREECKPEAAAGMEGKAEAFHQVRRVLEIGEEK
ncbi:hypothetical protein KAR91_59970 [Candidatus Pacearchaeota archaeon]|nr:hypothetical protein [Candidatus Pacearchaeota archaeon]